MADITPKKILFLIKDRIYDSNGVTSGLFNSAQFVVNFLCEYGMDAKLIPVVDGNAIDREVTQFNPEIVVIEALWASPAKMQELLNIQRHSKRSWIIRIHSKAPFLSNEGMATAWIHDYTRIKTDRIIIAPNTEELTEQFKVVFPNGHFLYLPNLYKAPEIDSVYSPEKDTINVGCFGAIRPMKNQYLQAIAAIDFANKEGKFLKFHMNTSRVEQQGQNVLKNIQCLFKDSKHQLVEHGWYFHKDFLKIASTMDVGMQCSMSESFNIVSADFVKMGVPIVVSNDIEWMPGILKASPTDWVTISDKLRFAYSARKLNGTIQKLYLKWYLYKSEWRWIKDFCCL